MSTSHASSAKTERARAGHPLPGTGVGPHEPFTLHQQVDDDGVEAPGVGGGAGVVARVLGFHRAQHQRAVGLDQAMAIHCHRDGRVLTVGRGQDTSAQRDAARALDRGLGSDAAGSPRSTCPWST